MPKHNYGIKDFHKSELQNFILHNVAGNITGAGEVIDGRMWYDSTADVYKGYANGSIITFASGGGVANAYAVITDGTTPASATGGDTFKLRTGNTILAIATQNNDATHGDNALFTVNEGNITHNNLSGLATGDPHTQYVLATGARAFSGNQSMGGFKLTNLGDATAAADAVNLGQLDAVKRGFDTKDDARLATNAALAANTRTGNVLTASANGVLGAIDGTVPALNDRILVKNEATGANNGLYFVSSVGAAGAPWTLTRTLDADSSAEVTPGMTVTITEGSVNLGSRWWLATSGAVVLNTTALTFAQDNATSVSGSNAGTLGSGVYDGKTGNILQFRHVAGTTDMISATLDDVNNNIVLNLANSKEADIGDAAASSFNVAHNFNTRKVRATVYRNATPWDDVDPDTSRPDVNTMTINFGTYVPTAAEFHVIITRLI